MARKPHILMVATSHSDLGATGRKTGLWLEGFAAPYYVFVSAGAIVTVASPAGGLPPLDPQSIDPEVAPAATMRFRRDPAAQTVLAHTVELADLRSDEFDAVFFPGGYGPMWDLALNEESIALLDAFATTGRYIGAVCHAPAALLGVRIGNVPFVHGKRVTAFSDAEEASADLVDQMPFSLESALKELGAFYQSAGVARPLAIADGTLVTGQNPASSYDAARIFMNLLDESLLER
ncbi:type 1 glutamine amidotransferase domain-containing protein [Rhizobium mesosinicum]|uniref:Type 1 glutamine amidotransferase domain-containing protein n=1 Tax=Rhizobium mesosinicum TaxID=335017 RepID=A0ABS7GN60_9HYPH|nr:type 1 glutamine amidotransferase domain-containing protein [Rhizobium mesosinicum]MBW9051076.1 type 1 glutamine amidotransferase domain-containing protein [Rhizobium mesosinicum]